MKFRNGFVSNSSSASFILIAKTSVPNSKNFGLTYQRGKRIYNDWEYINIPDFAGEINYCRSDIMRIDSISDKIRYIMALYARWYETDPDYFRKVLTFKSKIFNLGLGHWYYIHIPIVPLYAHWEWFDDTEPDYETHKIETYVEVSTECSYSKKIVDMCEDEDTTRLDSFIFNPQSFGILGGDEYEETYRLRAKCAPELTYDYERIADDPSYKKGDLWYINTKGEEVHYDHDYSWVEDCLNKVEMYDSLPEENRDNFDWDSSIILNEETVNEDS